MGSWIWKREFRYLSHDLKLKIEKPLAFKEIMWDFVAELIGRFLFEGLRDLFIKIFQFLGTCLKWTFYLGKRKFSEVHGMPGNGRLGFFICLLISLAISLLFLLP